MSSHVYVKKTERGDDSQDANVSLNCANTLTASVPVGSGSSLVAATVFRCPFNCLFSSEALHHFSLFLLKFYERNEADDRLQHWVGGVCRLHRYKLSTLCASCEQRTATERVTFVSLSLSFRLPVTPIS